MNNYQETTLKEILKDVKVRCTKCHSEMIRVIDLYDDTLIGYSCKNCPHYNLLDNDPV
jgi:transposase-like protein